MLLSLVTTCTTADAALLAKAAGLVDSFDLAGALKTLQAASPDCDEAAGRVEYLEGLLGALEAARDGGTVDSLRETRSAVHALSRRAEGRGGRWEVASVVLQAAIAGAQSERDVMAVYLEQATRLELLQLEAKQSPAPLISALELAGDLWLLVHQFEEARRAYERAREHVGPTGRVLLGLARASVRLKDHARACAEYARLLEWWAPRTSRPAEVVEAWLFAGSLACAARPPQ